MWHKCTCAKCAREQFNENNPTPDGWYYLQISDREGAQVGALLCVKCAQSSVGTLLTEFAPAHKLPW